MYLPCRAICGLHGVIGVVMRPPMGGRTEIHLIHKQLY